MRTIPIARGIMLVLLTLAVCGQGPAAGEQRRTSSFHGIASQKKTAPEPLQVKRGDNRKGICYEARFKAAAAALELSERAQELRMCASIGDLTQGCSSEYDRVRSAHESFETAVVSAGGCG